MLLFWSLPGTGVQVSGMERVVLKNGVDSLGIIWSKEIGHWNDLTLKGIENHKLDARNVQGPPTQCLSIRSNSSWPKRIETWPLLVLQKWTRKVLSRFEATAQRPCSMQMAFWNYRHDLLFSVTDKNLRSTLITLFGHPIVRSEALGWTLGQIGTSCSNAMELNVPPAWNSKESEQSICMLFCLLYVLGCCFFIRYSSEWLGHLRITSDCLHQMTSAAMSSRSQSQIQVYFRGNHWYCQRLWRRSNLPTHAQNPPVLYEAQNLVL